MDWLRRDLGYFRDCDGIRWRWLWLINSSFWPSHRIIPSSSTIQTLPYPLSIYPTSYPQQQHSHPQESTTNKPPSHINHHHNNHVLFPLHLFNTSITLPISIPQSTDTLFYIDTTRINPNFNHFCHPNRLQCSCSIGSFWWGWVISLCWLWFVVARMWCINNDTHPILLVQWWGRCSVIGWW